MDHLKATFLALLLASFITQATPCGDVEATVTNVYDGDTLTVNIPNWPDIVGDKMSVRLLGIDAPEIRGKCAKEKELAAAAKNLVFQFVDSKPVILRNVGRDKYFRLLAEVYVGEQSLSSALINAGLAVPYNGDTKVTDWCAQ
jgi:micrococcal nuclease